jgi:hypothetical protein
MGRIQRGIIKVERCPGLHAMMFAQRRAAHWRMMGLRGKLLVPARIQIA